MNNQEWSIYLPIVQSLIAAIIYGLSVFIYKFIYKKIQLSKDSFTQKHLHNFNIISYSIYIVILVFLYFKEILSLKVILLSYFFVSFIYIIFLYKYIFNLKKIGIVGSDLHINTGFGYLQTIKASKTNFRFLGVGARKLTMNEACFEQMVERVSKNGNQVQLLLCHPSSNALKYLSTRANKSPDDYSHKVKSSLQYLARLVDEKNYVINIRFYHPENVHDMPIFRLVFINSAYCLTSYTQFNDSTHEGQLMPQIHFIKDSNKDAGNSFYFAFETYYERLWEQSAGNIWNPNDYI